MKRFFLITIINCAMSLMANAQTSFEGKYGASLKCYLQENYSPSKYISTYLGNDGAWNIFSQCDVNADGTALDRYSTNKYYYPEDVTTAPSGMTIDYVINLDWWGRDVTDAVKWDLYNMMPCNSDVPKYKNDYMPGVVVDPIYTNDVWAMGWGRIDGFKINVYSPPKGYEGDFARAIMYMATIYPADRWSGQGVNFFADGDSLTLNHYSRQILLQWHNLDPVSAVERCRNEVISSIQGNRNPYVDYPHLVDYIWGSKSSGSNNSGEDDNEQELVPLKATYSLSSDSRIDLYSPYIPTDVSWRINGVVVDGTSVELQSLGLGVHELRFESTTIKGKLKIKIIE